LAVALGDVDGDGRLDIVTANEFSNSVTVLHNDGAGGFGLRQDFDVGLFPTSVALGDVDGGGEVDVVTANLTNQQFGGTVSVLRNDGAGGFAAHADVNVGAKPRAVALGDMDGDGDLDLATTDTLVNPGVTVLRNDGAGGFGLRRSFATAAVP